MSGGIHAMLSGRAWAVLGAALDEALGLMALGGLG
jgi:hypothetical protein